MTKEVGSRDYRILGGIVLLSLFLRVWGLNAPLWYDEIQTVNTHLRLSWGDMMQTYSMNHHYLYSIQAKFFIALFGESAWAVRMPAMLFGVGTVAAIWWLARDIAGTKIAHITALLIALSYHQIWFSQNARGYTELAFWSTTAMIFFLRGIQGPAVKTWIAYGVCLALALATHLTGAFFFLAQGLVWLFVAMRAIGSEGVRAPIITAPIVGYAVGGLLTLAFYAPILPSLFETISSVGDTSSTDLMQEYRNPFWAVMEGVRTGMGSLGVVAGGIALAVVTVIIAGSYSLWTSERLFPVVIGLHIVLTIGVLSAIGMRIWPRFFFVDIAFLMLLIVHGVRYLSSKISTHITHITSVNTFAAGVAAMVLISGMLASRNYIAPKQNLVGAYQLAESLKGNDASVYGVGVGAEIFTDFYKANWGEIEEGKQLDEALNSSETTYFIVAFPDRTFRTFPILETMAEDGKLHVVKHFPGTLGDGAVVVLRRD